MPGKSPGAAAVRGTGQDGLILLHDLGNSLVAVAFGLERLRGRQRTEELETLVERTLEQGRARHCGHANVAPGQRSIQGPI
jgi:hypothetical protein